MRLKLRLVRITLILGRLQAFLLHLPAIMTSFILSLLRLQLLLLVVVMIQAASMHTVLLLLERKQRSSLLRIPHIGLLIFLALILIP
jgi:hypothetical protein